MKKRKILSVLLTICILISAFCITPFSTYAANMVNKIYLKPHQNILQMSKDIAGSYFQVTYMGPDGMGESEMLSIDGQHFKANINATVDNLEFRLKDINGNEFWMSNMFCDGTIYNCVDYTDDMFQAKWSQYTEPDMPPGDGEVAEISTVYLLPCNAWVNIQGTYKARFVMTDGSAIWKDMKRVGGSEHFSVDVPENFQRVVFCVLPHGADNNMSQTKYMSETFSTELIADNCLVLDEPTGTNKITKGRWERFVSDPPETGGDETEDVEAVWGSLTEQPYSGTLESLLHKTDK